MHAAAMRETGQGIELPWVADGKSLLDEVREEVSCQTLAVGIIHGRKAQPDELLAVQGVPATAVKKWCDAGVSKDKLIAEAKKKSVAEARPGKGGSALHRSGHAIVCVVPESVADNRWWWLMLTRTGSPFNSAEQSMALMLLRQWQAEFALPREVQLQRVLLGHDNRLIAADLETYRTLLVEPTWLEELITPMHRVIEQRYPELADDEQGEIALQLGDVVYWIVFTRKRPISGKQNHHWYIELRPMEEDELPPVAEIEDDRIARTIAFLHANVATAPSLSQVAKQAHMSPFHFHRLFSRQVGISPKQYLQRKQLQTAKWLLRAHRIPIGDIAELTGFSSHGHFTSTFHRIIGVSPTEYRESFY